MCVRNARLEFRDSHQHHQGEQHDIESAHKRHDNDGDAPPKWEVSPPRRHDLPPPKPDNDRADDQPKQQANEDFRRFRKTDSEWPHQLARGLDNQQLGDDPKRTFDHGVRQRTAKARFAASML
ncbi:hypothetical protein [Pseudorhodoplanes sp.]|uniref:hypothetical protein n=1 Tax=Pseudorhodoplanes sp. TaxID=1934341 RepID=UPI003D14DB39